MTKILIVGNSLAAVGAIEHIRQQNADAQVALFATESSLPYDRHLLPSLVAGKIKEIKIHPMAEDFFRKHKVDVITGEKLARISVKRKYVTTEKKTQIGYNRLVLLDTGALILPAVKGHHKKGVFDAWTLTSAKALVKHMPFADNFAVSVSNPQGLNIACALSDLKKEVMVVCSTATFWPDMLDEETGALLKQVLEGKGIRVLAENDIEEILGDTDVKAIRLRSGKVVACEAVILDQARPDMRMLSEPELPEGDEIILEDCFKAAAMPFSPCTFGFGVVDGFLAGVTKLPAEGREYLKFDGPQNIYKKIYAQGDHLVGTVLFNAPQDQQRLWDIIQSKQIITGKEEDLLA